MILCSAEYLEGVFGKAKFVLQIFVYGDSTQTCLVAVVVPDPDVLKPWATQNNIPVCEKSYFFAFLYVLGT